jgi:hypothetical protein
LIVSEAFLHYTVDHPDCGITGAQKALDEATTRRATGERIIFVLIGDEIVPMNSVYASQVEAMEAENA